MMAEDDFEKRKMVEFYAAATTAWFDTRIEHDKSLLTLSAGGIGLLLTLLTTVGVSSADGLVLYILAMVSFLLCLGAVLIILNRNADHIEASIKTDGHPSDPLLAALDRIAIMSFAVGILFSSVIGISAAINSYSTKEKAMANENKQKTGYSVNGVSTLKPAGELDKSFNGMNSFKPSTPQGSSGSSSGTSQGSTPAANQNTDKKQ